MSDDQDFLKRWSRRKTAAREGKPQEAGPAKDAIQGPRQVTAPQEAPAPLPPVESLTPESDFTGFMKPDVDPLLRRDALKVLMRDPRFNVMDGLDVYIDDYSKPDPLPPEWLGQLRQLQQMTHGVEPAEEEKSDAAEGDSALQKGMPEQPLGAESASDASNTAKPPEGDVDVTESGRSGGTLPRNEA